MAQEPDTVAFTRNANQFHNAQFVELPNGDYDFSLMRHFLYDVADQLRFEFLANSSYEPLAKVARKIKGELKYHVFHANTWVVKLGNGTEESKARMQTALNEAWNYALGMFETSEFENDLIAEGIFVGEEALKKQWVDTMTPIIGRKSIHTEHLAPLVDEMSEVFRVDPSAEW